MKISTRCTVLLDFASAGERRLFTLILTNHIKAFDETEEDSDNEDEDIEMAKLARSILYELKEV